MKSIRRSLKNSEGRPSPPPSAGSTTSSYAAGVGSGHHVLGGGADRNIGSAGGMAVSRPGQQGKTPPKKVIRATSAYRSKSPQELSFEVGDFFHVVGERGGEQDQPEWFDAANPLTGARGLVPVHCFQVLGRNEKENSMRGASAGSGATGGSVAGLISPPGSAGYPGPAGYPSQQTQHQQPGATRISAGSSTLSPTSGLFPQNRSGTPSGARPAPKPKYQTLYGVVQYDFRAERPDELDAKRGESIVVVAQSNNEWFVAKPIGRLGGPGLIPVSFVAISDTTTGDPLPAEKVRDMIDSGMVPPVEEWKKATAEYKQASIPLGRFDFPNAAPAQNGNSNGPYGGAGAGGSSAGAMNSATSLASSGPSGNRPPSGPSKAFSPQSSTASVNRQYSQQQPNAPQPVQEHHDPNLGQSGASGARDSRRQESSGNNYSPTKIADEYYGQEHAGAQQQGDDEEEEADYYDRYGLVTNATVESFHSEEENFWFHLRVTFAQSGYSLILYRLYDDFLEFQYALMDDHPVEAGKELAPGANPATDQPNRIIPKMPGPVDFVDEVVCAQRVDDLTVYLKGLCKLPDYIRAHPLFYEFLVPRPGDVEAVTPDGAMRARWEAEKQRDRERDRELANSANGTRQRGLDEEVVEYLDKMQLNGNEGQPPASSSSLPPLTTSMSGNGPFAPNYSMSGGMNQSHQRNESSQYRPPSSSSNNGGMGASYMSPASTSRQSDSGPLSAGSGINFISPFASSSQVHLQQQASASSSSLPTQNQQANPPAFVKIKIFHRNTDDLIAIRVPPSITLVALLDKVRERLGGDVEHVRYRDEGSVRLSTGQMQGALSLPGGAKLVELRNDDELDAWIRAAQRLVAYVD